MYAMNENEFSWIKEIGFAFLLNSHKATPYEYSS